MEMSSVPSFQNLFQLIDQGADSGAKAGWAYLVGLLFQANRDESVIPEMVDIWQLIVSSASIDPETRSNWAGIAQKHDLPAAFVEAIKA